jgi:mercuric ion binding protein
MRRFAPIALFASLILAAPAMAAERTVTLAVENMTCETCPLVVRQAIKAVPGVARVEASFEHKTATVTFDDAKTTVDAIAAASTQAGYPAKPATGG